MSLAERIAKTSDFYERPTSWVAKLELNIENF